MFSFARKANSLLKYIVSLSLACADLKFMFRVFAVGWKLLRAHWSICSFVARLLFPVSFKVKE